MERITDNQRLKQLSACSRIPGRIRFLLLLLVLCSVLMPFVDDRPVLKEVARYWHEVLTLSIPLLGISLFFLSRDLKQTYPWRDFAIWLLVASGLITLFILKSMRFAIALTLMIGLRLAIPVLWLFVIAGLPILMLQILKRRRLSTRRSIRWGPWWFSAFLFLCLGEPLCQVLWQRWNTPEQLAFPEDLSQPPDNELHIASIGGSTSLGWPYHPHMSFARAAAWQLQRSMHPNADVPANADARATDDESAAPAASSSETTATAAVRIVLHNTARPGDSLRLAIRRMQDLKVKPHVIVLYTGHNELYHDVDGITFVENSPLFLLDRTLSLSPMFRVIDQTLTARFSAMWGLKQVGRNLVERPFLTRKMRLQRVKLFTERLRQLAQYCGRHNIRPIWFIPAASEADCPPNRSVTGSVADISVHQRMESLYRRALELEQQQNWLQAAETYDEGLRDYPNFAEFQYRLGHCRLHLQQFDEARVNFQSALENDAYPVRAQSDYRDAVRQVATEFGIVTIDAGGLLRDHTEHGILDHTMFLDDVHPTLKAVFVLGTALADALRQMSESPLQHAAAEETGPFRQMLSELGPTPDQLIQAYELMAGAMPNRARLRFDESHWHDLAARLRSAAANLHNLTSLPDRTDVESLQDSQW